MFVIFQLLSDGAAAFDSWLKFLPLTSQYFVVIPEKSRDIGNTDKILVSVLLHIIRSYSEFLLVMSLSSCFRFIHDDAGLLCTISG